MQVVFAGPTCAHVRKYAAKLIDVFFDAAANVGRNFDRDKGSIGRHGLTAEDTEADHEFVLCVFVVELFTTAGSQPRIHTKRKHETTPTNNLLPWRKNNNLLRGTLDGSLTKRQRARGHVAPVVQLIFPMCTVWSP